MLFRYSRGYNALILPAFRIDHKENLPNHTQGLPSFFARCIFFTSIRAFKPFRIGKNILGIFKAEAFMVTLVFFIFIIVPLNAEQLHSYCVVHFTLHVKSNATTL